MLIFIVCSIMVITVCLLLSLPQVLYVLFSHRSENYLYKIGFLKSVPLNSILLFVVIWKLIFVRFIQLIRKIAN